MNRAVAIGAGVVVAVVAAAAIGMQAMNSRLPPPNVLIVLWDTVRADRMTMYGYDKPTTPRVAAWAESSAVVYENALSPAMWTVPSHASMFTGRMPTTHGAGYDWRWLDTHNMTLAEWFGSNGYDTYAFSANPNLSTGRVNLLQGFQHVDMSWSKKFQRRVVANTRRKLLKRDKSTEISPAYRGGASSTFSYNAGPVTKEALVGWLEEREDDTKPWLAYLSYMEAHKPRVPSLQARRRVARDDEVIRTGLATDLTMKSQLLYSYGLLEYTESELEAINAVYDATLVDLDESTGDLLDELAMLGHLDNTIVVLTSDHGENLGEHELFGHRHGVYQPLVHVPLILSYPPRLDPKRVSERVANLDIFNTLCELAGISTPEQVLSRGSLVAGVAALQEVFTESISIDRLGWQKISKWAPERFEEDPRAKRFKSVLKGNWKLIAADDGSRELYDLAVDPEELNDLSTAQPDKVAELNAMIEGWAAQVPPYDPSKQTPEDKPKIDDEDMKAQLKLLGYLSDDEDEDDGAEGEGDEGAPPLE
jgi:arylsulfatase A-like enzyme